MLFKPRLDRIFFDRPALGAARALLGKRLVRQDGNVRLSGIIVETEAYSGEDDLGCHCKHGRTPRTQVMYGPPGYAYVYFTYGMHWCLNFVVEREGFPAAILIRSIIPDEGLDVMAERRHHQPQKHWTDGPAKICQALKIDAGLNGADLCSAESQLWIEIGEPVAAVGSQDTVSRPDSGGPITGTIDRGMVVAGPRIGLNNVPEPWKSIPWRFLVK